MTLVVYLSYGVPCLRALASHGKTRIPDKNDGQQQSRKMGIQALFNSDIFLIGKHRFTQFYYIGIIWLTASVLLANQPGVLPCPSLVVLYIHLFRRLYECLFIHKWRTASRMHIAGYAVGLIHYLWLPSVFVRINCRDCLSSILGSLDPRDLLKFYGESANIKMSHWPPVWLRMPAILFCLWAQWQQHRHHVYLAELRNTASKEKPLYSLPTKGWFSIVTCPHYLAEIAIYGGFAMILAQEGTSGLRHWIVFAWVASNLSLSATMNHRWYRQRIPSQMIEGKWAIFPYIL